MRRCSTTSTPSRGVDRATRLSNGRNGSRRRSSSSAAASLCRTLNDKGNAMEQRAANARSSLLAAIMQGGLVAGTLDIGAAALINGVSPAFIVRFVAGGVLGKD